MIVNSETLKNIPFFSELTTRNQSALAKVCELHHFNSSQQIVAQNTRSRRVYFILSGRVRIAYHTLSSREVIIYENSEGDMFDALSLVNRRFRSPRATAITPVTVISMVRKEFCNALQVYPELSNQLNLYLASILCTLSERIVEFNILNVNSRIHAELVRMSSKEKVQNNKVTINPMPTHAEIADRISAHREAVTREFKRLEQKGLILRKSKRLTILDLNKLKKLLTQIFDKSFH